MGDMGNTIWGRPTTPLRRMVKIARSNNQLRSRINEGYIRLIKNNIWVLRGFPLMAFLFIIYDDVIMNKYNKSIMKVGNNITKSKTIIRSDEYEQKWTELIYNRTNNEDCGNIKHEGKTNGVNTSLDHVLVAGDASIEYKNQDTIKKLQTYNNTETKENFKINWEK